MRSKSIQDFVNSTNNFIRSKITKEKYRINEKDFTRNRKLPFENVVLFMLRLLRKTIQIELNNFLKELSSSTKAITSSAFVQSRKKLKPDLFYDLNRVIVNEFYSDNDENVKLFKGLRLLSVDGSTIQLPVTDELKESYGIYKNQSKSDDVILARVSVLYDLLNDIVLDGKLCNFQKGEVPLSREHFLLAQKGDLIIMDRAYPSFLSMDYLQKNDIHFLFRCKQNFSNEIKSFYESGKKDEIIQLTPSGHKSFKDLPYKKDHKITVRLLRIKLSSGEIEILMSSLLDKSKFGHQEFKALYFTRWKVETFYNRFKNIVGADNFSGTSNQFIQQEFNCALYMSNMQTILTNDSQNEITEKYEKRKYEYKVNSTLSLSFIRERLIKIYSQKKETEKLLEELKELFIKNVVPIRNGRKNKRDVDKFRQRSKPKQFKNRKPFL